ncbi:hypothetical protein DFH07DRAFT_979586 [Mycena maculata]|uniref:non-specific serine/threonine protein kinase n=1 Tax=Mycena maculata TaxID=230809 RepID=A0AAD7II55_9AGAR|nr:hypothetical protein DFH07DRAFT_979586 [Mycena maculata]
MPALFRIVQDDYPPIPEGVSPIVKNFLYHCFQKDCNLRISAKKLLRHLWIAAGRRQMADGKAPEEEGGAQKQSARPGAEEGGRRPLSNYNYNEAVLKVQEWNEALKCVSSLRDISASPSSSSSCAWKVAAGPASKPHLAEKIQISPLSFSLQPPEEQTNNWDDDFEEGISLTKLQALEKTAGEPEPEGVDASAKENACTIRPNKSRDVKPLLPLAKPPPEEMHGIVEDYSALVGGEDEGVLERISRQVRDFLPDCPELISRRPCRKLIGQGVTSISVAAAVGTASREQAKAYDNAGYTDQFRAIFAASAIAKMGSVDRTREVQTPGGASSVPPEHTSIGILAALIGHLEANAPTPVLELGSPPLEMVHGPAVPHALKHAILHAKHSKKALKNVEGRSLEEPSALVGTTQAMDTTG